METKNQAPTRIPGVPEAIVSKFGGWITGILCGFDRVGFRATLRLLFTAAAMKTYLQACGVLIKDFKDFAEKITQRIRDAAWAAAGQPVPCLASPQQSKEELARKIAREDGIASGLIAVFSAVEPCLSHTVRGEHQPDGVCHRCDVPRRGQPCRVVSAVHTPRNPQLWQRRRAAALPCPDKFRGEDATTLKRRPEGVRLKHAASGNSLKVYDKQGSMLRVETTINKPQPFQVYRPSEADPGGRPAWRCLRRGVADPWRRAEVSRAANGRYLGALASVTGKTALAQEARSVCRARIVDGQRHRALNPWSPSDGVLLEAISQGEFALNGLRNRDLRALLYPAASTAADKKRQSAAITRQLALLRAHGVLKKVTGTHRWQLTDNGRRIVTALLAAQQADVDQLTKMAA
jgi:hypothetical protein